MLDYCTSADRRPAPGGTDLLRAAGSPFVCPAAGHSGSVNDRRRPQRAILIGRRQLSRSHQAAAAKRRTAGLILGFLGPSRRLPPPACASSPHRPWSLLCPLMADRGGLHGAASAQIRRRGTKFAAHGNWPARPRQKSDFTSSHLDRGEPSINRARSKE
jgi:hypothetical protein